jgi:hypothetical protein
MDQYSWWVGEYKCMPDFPAVARLMQDIFASAKTDLDP